MDAGLDGSRMGKYISIIQRFKLSGKDLDGINSCASGIQDLYGGIKDLAECVGGFRRLFHLLDSVPHAAARFIRRCATSIFYLVYYRNRTIGDQTAPVQHANPSYKVVSTIEEARSAASVWTGQRELIDIPNNLGADIAEQIWIIFVDQGAGCVIDNAYVLAAKIGKQKILREKVKAARAELEAKQKALKVLEEPMNALRDDVHACNEQLQELLLVQDSESHRNEAAEH